MFASKRRLFDSERGAATSWLAGITSAALLIGTVALPAMAEDGATPEPTVTSETVDPSEVEAQAAADAAAAEAEAAGEQQTAGPAAEAEAKAAADAAAAEAEAKAAADAAAAEAEAKAAADAAAAEAEAQAAADAAAAEAEAVIGEPVEDVATGASSTDGDTPDINSPPVEELAAASENPTITTDKADYPPGATVTIIGEGWAGGEAVHIFVNDESSKSWTHNSNPDPVAGAKGLITDEFTLPAWFVSNYSANATGLTSVRSRAWISLTCPSERTTSARMTTAMALTAIGSTATWLPASPSTTRVTPPSSACG